MEFKNSTVLFFFMIAMNKWEGIFFNNLLFFFIIIIIFFFNMIIYLFIVYGSLSKINLREEQFFSNIWYIICVR